MFSRLLSDLRFALRGLVAKPGFAAAVILTLALGIGANALVFTLIDGVYLSDLPYRDADELIDVYGSWGKMGGGIDSVSIPDYVDLRSGMKRHLKHRGFSHSYMMLALSTAFVYIILRALNIQLRRQRRANIPLDHPRHTKTVDTPF